MTDTSPVRVRFAPSPTGALHLGSARSALYNWLFARHHGASGRYILRIEDTDQARSTPEHVEQALSVFRWLGLDWDEGPEIGGAHGPYFQSKRKAQYDAALKQLLESGHAYHCFCTKEELDAERKAAEEAKQPFVYSGRCYELDTAEAKRRAENGEAHVIRFRVPETGSTVVPDLVLGDAEFEHALMGDFVIARADGSPLYNFANVIDDADMQITHVIRGNDHLSNTAKQILLYKALEAPVPAFAHLPMVLGPDGAKLSKRRHHTSNVEDLAAQGYTPAAVRNAIALVGWSKDGETQVMTTPELVESFELSRVRKAPAQIDYDKLAWINAEHLRALSVEEWARGYEAWRADWFDADGDEALEQAAHALDGKQAAFLVQEKCGTYGEVPDYLRFLVNPFTMSEAAAKRLDKSGEVGAQVLRHVSARLDALEDFSLEQIEAILRSTCDELELKAGKVFSPVRFAVTGQTIAPGLWESIFVLGKDRAVERLELALARFDGSRSFPS